VRRLPAPPSMPTKKTQGSRAVLRASVHTPNPTLVLPLSRILGIFLSLPDPSRNAHIPCGAQGDRRGFKAQRCVVGIHQPPGVHRIENSKDQLSYWCHCTYGIRYTDLGRHESQALSSFPRSQHMVAISEMSPPTTSFYPPLTPLFVTNMRSQTLLFLHPSPRARLTPPAPAGMMH